MSEGRLSRAVGRVALVSARWVRASLSYAWPPVFGAVALASIVWYLRGKDRARLLGTNAIPFKQQLEAVIPVGVALGALLVVFLGAITWRRLRAGRLDTARVLETLGSWLIPLGAAPFVLALFQPDIEKKSPFLTLFYAAIAAALVGWGAYRIGPGACAAPEPDAPTPRWRVVAARAAPFAALGAILVMGGAYAWFFSKTSITNHHALVTRSIDLGIYDNIFYQSIHGRPLACTFIKAEYHGSAHFDPILVLLSPLYLIYPRAELILVLQSVWIATGAIPVYLLTRHVLGSRLQAVVVAACYLLHPALHGANLYEFHSLTLAPMPILWTLYCAIAEKRAAYWVALGAALLVREDVPLMMSMLGITLLLSSSPASRKRGLVTVLVCAVYFAVVKLVFMTSAGLVMSGQDSYSFGYYYQELIQGGKGMGSMLLSLLTNPAFVVAQVFEEPKMQFVVTVFLPLLFLPFFAKRRRLLLAYGLALTLLASRTAVFSTHFQYTSTLLPFAFAITPSAVKEVSEGALARLRGWDPVRAQRALVLACLVASACVSFKFGGIVENKTFRGGFHAVVRKLTPQQRELYAFVDEASRSIPKNRSVGVTNKLGPHVSNRRHVYFYGQRGTDYVFVDETELKKDRKDKHKQAVDQGRLVEIMRKGTYALFQTAPAKVDPPKEDADGDLNDVLGDPPKDE